MTPAPDLDTAAADGSGTPLELSSAFDVQQLVRTHGSLFLVTNRIGNVTPRGARELGLFNRDTRFVSFWSLRVESANLVHLSSDRSHDAFNQLDLMISGTEAGEFLDDPQNYVHVRRRQLLDDSLVEEVILTSYLDRPVTVELVLDFEADFADIFEVRGANRARRGTRTAPVVEADRVSVGYDGLDGVHYATEFAFVPAPQLLQAGSARFSVSLEAGATDRLYFTVTPQKDGEAGTSHRATFAARSEQLLRNADSFRHACTRIRCNDGVLQEILEQSVSDLGCLRIDVGSDQIIAAGIPWFCAPFGRDALITSYASLMLNPNLAKDSLRVLAAFQGVREDAFTEEEPGKIFHELRFGEMARTRETPHSPYYGSIDSTPLFVVVAAAVYRATADRAWLEEIEPALCAALRWIDERSEQGTRMVTYARRHAGGLDNQGWKDSRAAVVAPSGKRAVPPIALCEIQGYCIDAYAQGAYLLHALGRHELAECYDARKLSLSARFEAEFWLPQLNRHAYAIDGQGDKLDTVVSNLGHLLWSGVLDAQRARDTADLLLAGGSFSGYGLRTLASGQAAYNPLSYHNGTVWPHDNALIVDGLARYGQQRAALTVFEGLIAAMHHFDDHRLPELFCGLPREDGSLVRYPVACSPQAWAAATPFLLLQATLGLSFDAPDRRIVVRRPGLPASLDWLELDNLRVGQSRVHLRVARRDGRVEIEKLDITGAHLRAEVDA